MNQYVTGTMIKTLREKRGLTQLQLAERMNVSDKAVSKWETGRGYPDITLIQPLAEVLGVSVIELMQGESVVNTNRSSNMNRTLFHVCPVCGNIIQSTGEAVISCCGITLPALESEIPDPAHGISIEIVEDEYYITTAHPMTKTHHISFFAAIKDDAVELVKLYPEWDAQARFKINGTRAILWYCNHHGLFKTPVRPHNRSTKQEA